MTAYEMRISDWSSDVCSSDLGPAGLTAANEDYNPLVIANLDDADRLVAMVVHKPPHIPARLKPALYRDALKYGDHLDGIFSSDDRRVGKECVSTCRSRWERDH